MGSLRPHCEHDAGPPALTPSWLVMAMGVHRPLSQDAGAGGWVLQWGAGGNWCSETFLERVPAGPRGRQGSPSGSGQLLLPSTALAPAPCCSPLPESPQI